MRAPNKARRAQLQSDPGDPPAQCYLLAQPPRHHGSSDLRVPSQNSGTGTLLYKDAEAKPYQVRQALKAIDKLQEVQK
jgi:hypothetical protein